MQYLAQIKGETASVLASGVHLVSKTLRDVTADQAAALERTGLVHIIRIEDEPGDTPPAKQPKTAGKKTSGT